MVVSRWLEPGNRTFLYMASMVVTWWIVAFFALVDCQTVLSALASMLLKFLFIMLSHSRLRLVSWVMRQSGDQVIEHFDDDKEYGAGRKLLLLLRNHNITNKFVCVTRWYGGVNLGPARFEYILEAAKQTLGIDDHSKPAAEHKHSHHAELHGLTQVSSHSSGRRSSLRSNSDDDSESDASNTDNER